MRRSSVPRRQWFRLPSSTDDRGSMPMLMLVVLVGMSFAALLIPMVLTQNQSTRFDTSRVHSLHAAESGFDAALGFIRSATSADGKTGDAKKLPCGPLNGTVNGAGGGNGSYTVTIAYYVTDPGTRINDADWLTGNAMRCAKGYGPYHQPTDSYTPSFVLLTSTGTGGNGASAGRTLQSTYVVKTTNTNIAGGRIRIFPGSDGSQLCMVPITVPAAAGGLVVLQPCDPLTADKRWSYNADLSIQLVSSVTDTAKVKEEHSNGLCLDSGGSHVAGAMIILQWCARQVDVAGVPRNVNAPWNQKWSSDDNAHLRGSNSAKTDTSTLCINGASAPNPQQITLQECREEIPEGAEFIRRTDPNQAWIPDRNVGAGAAGAPEPLPEGYMASMHQLVNFYQFGRCLDVTAKVTGSEFLIAYSCKQNPGVDKVAWNQRWAYNSSTQRWVTNNGQNYCLVSPKVDGEYVTVKLCRTITDDSAKWTNNLTQDRSGGELPYADKYTMVDSANKCMSVGSDKYLHDDVYYKIIVVPCTGTPEQKWNAQPNLQTPVLQNTIEVPLRRSP